MTEDDERRLLDHLQDTANPHLYKDGVLSTSSALDFASIAAGAIGTATLAVTGAVTGQAVILGAPSTVEAGLAWSGFVSAADTVTVRLHNTTGAPIDPASATWTAKVFTQ